VIVVLVVASGDPWEPEALRLLGERPDVVVLKRCVDLPDLLASATSGQAQVAVLGADTAGLDTAAVDHLLRHGVRPVAVAARAAPGGLDGARVQLRRIGVAGVVGDDDLASLPDAVTSAVAERDTREAPFPPPPPSSPPGGPHGRAIAVWGPAGAPGRSTVAAAVAAELARRRRPTVLVDADPYGGTLGQALGVLDEVSGLLAAGRWAVSGQLAERFTSVQRGLGPCLSIITGLPRPERWTEVRAEALEEVVDLARRAGDVVLDTGFGLDDDPGPQVGGRPSRDRLTTTALESADEVLVVGAADPVGLSRLARGVVDVRRLLPTTPLRVVVNRMRPSLGWSEKDISRMVADVARAESLHFLPDDRAAVDRALVAGRTLLEGGESDLTRAVAGLVDGWLPPVRPRRAGRARPR
jgi:MinD-like ATPase involved in chromosome partitioning or flagellar assembly